jgi:sulfur relay (sulfurtransferase) DsrF/TusC family protein
MPTPSTLRLALIVRGHPWSQRAARADLDLALAAAAMNYTLDVYFLGTALMQLAEVRDGKSAMLPAGYRAWAALPDVAEVTVFAEPEWLRRCDRAAIQLILPVQPLNAEAMQSGWRRCDHILVI